MGSRVKSSEEQIPWKERMEVRAERGQFWRLVSGIEMGAGKTDGLEER